MYRCVAGSIEGFVQQIATAYIPHGYWFYVQGWIPDCKRAEKIDEKLIERYGVAISKWARARRKQSGQACMQYLRYQNTFVLMATMGQHSFFELERGTIRDVRKTPIKIDGYSISARHGPDGKLHAHVRIEQERYKELKAHFLDNALRWSAPVFAKRFYEMSFEPYAPVRRQYLCILRAVNRSRSQAGLITLPTGVLPMRRRVVRAFMEHGEQEPRNASPAMETERSIARLNELDLPRRTTT